MNHKTGTLFAAILGSGIVSLDSSVVTVALPRIGQELPTRIFGVLEGQSYIYNGYSLTRHSALRAHDLARIFAASNAASETSCIFLTMASRRW